MAETPPLTPLLEATRVAVVGASARPGSVGDVVFRQLVVSLGRERVFPVNPRYEDLGDGPCHPDLAAIGRPIDLAVLAVPDDQLETQLAAAVAVGAGSAVIFGPCVGDARDGTPLVSKLGALAAGAGLPVCGGNGMGFVNVARGLTVCGFHQPRGLASGPVALLTHSGSFFSAALHAGRRFGFSVVVSTGNELATTMDAYLRYAVGMPSTRVVGLFLETIRRPAEFAASLEEAARRDVPVVALKVGRTERGQAAVATHTAAIAGDPEAFDAFLDHHGVHRTDTPEELFDTLELFAARRRAHPGGLGAVHDSGGERTLLIDAAGRLGVALPPVAPATADRLAAVLDPGLAPENPVDAWGTGRDALGVFESCFMALADDPGIGVLAYAVDLTPEEDDAASYVDVIERTFAATSKPAAVLTSLADAVDPGQAARLRRSGIPVLGSSTGLAAIKHLVDHPLRRARRPPPANGAAGYWRSRLGGPPLAGSEAVQLLRDFGVPVVDQVEVRSLAEARAAAASLGYPVALKLAGTDHKSDIGGVELALDSDEALAAAYRRLARRGPHLTVQPMVGPGVEVAVGVLHDGQFGPVVVVAAGGVLVEMMDDRAAALPPLDAEQAAALIRRLRIARLFAGFRGRPPADLGAAARAVSAVASMAVHLGDRLAGLDLNPVIVTGSAAVAVDVLVVGQGAGNPDIVASTEGAGG